MKIVFCHNVYNRFNTLKETIDIEKKLYPDSICVVGYNDQSPESIFIGYKNIEFLKFPGITHKIGCTNGFIATVKAAIKYSPDVIIFSHDDVSISSREIVEKNIEEIYNNDKELLFLPYDVICRKPMPEELYGYEYYMMEAVFMSLNAAEIMTNKLEYYDREENLPRDVRGSLSPEKFLWLLFQTNRLMVKEKRYIHQLENYNKTLSDAMGFTHKNVGERGWID